MVDGWSDVVEDAKFGMLGSNHPRVKLVSHNSIFSLGPFCVGGVASWSTGGLTWLRMRNFNSSGEITPRSMLVPS